MHRFQVVVSVIMAIMVAMLVAGCGTGMGSKSVGDTQSVEVDKQQVEATPTEVTDPLTGIGVSPPKGSRIVGVKIKFTNTGGKPVSFQPGGLVQLMASWRPMSPTQVDGGPCATSFTFDELTINPGESTEGCLVYDAPSEVKVTSLRMHSNTGRGSASWHLG
jgi:hypothetical protein